VDELLAFFKYDHDHLPGHLRKVSKACADLAHAMAKLPLSTELVAGLWKLLEAKDCLVRAAMAAQADDEAKA
jgi:hypothetical protein